MGIKSVVGRVASSSHRSGWNPSFTSMCDPSSRWVVGSASCVSSTFQLTPHPLGIWYPSMVTVLLSVRGAPDDSGLSRIVSLITPSRYGHSRSRSSRLISSPCVAIMARCSSTKCLHLSGLRPRKSRAFVSVEADVSDPARMSSSEFSTICSLVSFRFLLLPMLVDVGSSLLLLSSSSAPSSVAYTMALNVDSSGPSRSSCSTFSTILRVRYSLARNAPDRWANTLNTTRRSAKPAIHSSTLAPKTGTSSSARDRPRICRHATSSVYAVQASSALAWPLVSMRPTCRSAAALRLGTAAATAAGVMAAPTSRRMSACLLRSVSASRECSLRMPLGWTPVWTPSASNSVLRSFLILSPPLMTAPGRPKKYTIHTRGLPRARAMRCQKYPVPKVLEPTKI
mmetsp:Transcript_4469/g.10699  ORF Transcript_4469/g.10699 Transcript_4469/m.10699 type:complete len:397 (+) Transcript_4469:345-1535(+)